MTLERDENEDRGKFRHLLSSWDRTAKERQTGPEHRNAGNREMADTRDLTTICIYLHDIYDH
jgi:hypothetical protein